jgi:hypothetical protein
MLFDDDPLWSVVPSTAVTVTFQVVVEPETVGVNRRRASAGKTLAIPSIDQVPPRP